MQCEDGDQCLQYADIMSRGSVPNVSNIKGVHESSEERFCLSVSDARGSVPNF
jgi:hypothetical protein